MGLCQITWVMFITPFRELFQIIQDLHFKSQTELSAHSLHPANWKKKINIINGTLVRVVKLSFHGGPSLWCTYYRYMFIDALKVKNCCIYCFFLIHLLDVNQLLKFDCHFYFDSLIMLRMHIRNYSPLLFIKVFPCSLWSVFPSHIVTLMYLPHGDSIYISFCQC